MRLFLYSGLEGVYLSDVYAPCSQVCSSKQNRSNGVLNVILICSLALNLNNDELLFCNAQSRQLAETTPDNQDMQTMASQLSREVAM
jgi:hypothetical protein